MSTPTHTNIDSSDVMILRDLTIADQEIVWTMLQIAAKQETVDYVQRLPILAQYGLDYGTRDGDIGILALTNTSINSTGNNLVVGAAWLRFLPDGFAATDRFQPYPLDSEPLPELAIAVLPTHQGRGFGSALLECILQRATGKVRGVALSCLADNLAARKLYQQFGFVVAPHSIPRNRNGV
jgi:ribosomal protein S18 acetylase RimI-like enzyme